MPLDAVQVPLPEKLLWVFDGVARYRGAHGGRGSAKTRSFALMTAIRGMMFGQAGISGVILCGREHLNSLDESSMEEVKTAIRSLPWLEAYWDIGEKYIRSKDGRIKYVFAGLRHNLDSIKSKARILIAWVDEAEGVSEAAWRKLVPTVREEGSEIWVTWNPESPESATHKRFRANPPDGARIIELNWKDNPFFTKALETERQEDLRKRPDTYDHTWEGGFLTITEAQIFRGKYTVQEFEVANDWSGPHYGMDFGFAQDPTTAGEQWVDPKRNILYVRRDCGKVGLELDHTPKFFKDRMPGIEKHTIRADSARPESISYLKRHGLHRIEGVKKWQGSVEDGIEFIKSFEQVIIHPDAPGTAREFRLYSYKVDRLTGDILPIVVDAHNHYVDEMRYALAPMMKRSGYNLKGIF